MCVQAKQSEWEQPAAHGTTVSAPQALANLESESRALVGGFSLFFYDVCSEEKMTMTQSRQAGCSPQPPYPGSLKRGGLLSPES